MPEGTVTFLFSDVEGSTQLLERHGRAMGDALARHHALFEEIVANHEGVVFETVGDAVYAAFARPADAVGAALDIHRALAAEDWGPIGRLAVRIALHTGAVERRGTHYFGSALFRAARLQALGYGEQTLLSGATGRLLGGALPRDATLRSLGTHRLKDLAEPEEVHQLVHPDLRLEFPPLTSLDAHPHNLPVQASSFIGREAELAEVTALLAKHSLVTLIGPGGIGKTRLALQAAAEQIERFADGVFLVDLAPVRDRELVPGAIAGTLGLREQAGQPISAILAQHLRERSLLLVLDNLEQLLPAVGPTVAELLTKTPSLRLLATSRAPLRIRAEREYHVPALATGRTDQLEPKPPAAVALFVERARAIGVDLSMDAETGPLLAAICGRLDGLPLAIELAAARLRVFDLAQLNDRLAHRLSVLAGGARDLPERQRTLRDAISWSTELLSPAERQLFARLGVFVGGFSLEAVEDVAGPGLRIDVLEAVTAVAEHSLIRLELESGREARYAMLETIREHAAERLEASGEGHEIRERHAQHFSDLVSDLVPRLETADQLTALVRLRTEVGNLRASLDYRFAADPTEYLRVVHLLVVPWLYFDGRLGEYEAVLLRARTVALAASSSEKARWSLDLGHLRFAQGDAHGARAALTDTLNAATAERLGRDRLIALRLMAGVAREREDFAEAQRYIQMALTDAHSSAEVLEEGHSRLTSALIAMRMGRYDAAAEECRAALSIFELHNDLSNIASARLVYGQVLEFRRELAAAQREYQAALEVFQTLGDDLGVIETRMSIGYLRFLRGDSQEAVASILEAADAMQSAGKRLELTRALATLAVVIDSLGSSAVAARLLGWCEAEMERLGMRWTAETHAESTVEVARYIHLQRDHAWEQERQRGRSATVPQLLTAARDAVQMTSTAR